MDVQLQSRFELSPVSSFEAILDDGEKPNAAKTKKLTVTDFVFTPARDIRI